MQKLGDPRFQYDRFWSQPCKLLERLVKKVIEIEKDEANRVSLTTARLIDTINNIAHALYGKKDSTYESQMLQFLPFPIEKEEEELEGAILPNKATLKIFFEEVDRGRIPAIVVSHLQPLLDGWRKALK